MRATDPAHRHGGPGAGWYRPTAQCWRPVPENEAANERHEDMRHFMTDPREAEMPIEQRIANLEAITGLIPEHQALVDDQIAALKAIAANDPQPTAP